MPYSGPSTGCVTCLARKVKCDERKPICMRCERSKKTCGGYRAAVDIIFRDDTESARRRTHKKLIGDGVVLEVRQDGTGSSPIPTLPAAGVNPAQSRIVLSSMVEPLGRRAVTTFFNDYAWTRKKYTFSLDFLPREYNLAKSDSCLIATTEAVAMAHLGHVSGDINIQRMAIKQYGSALSLTNTALSRDWEAFQDETMMSVHLLILFENITTTAAGATKSLLPWLTHVGGATLLVLRRGPSQLARDVGLAMFQIQVVKMIVYGFINGERTPNVLEDWLEMADLSLRDPSFRLMKTISSGAWLLERAKKILLSNPSSENPSMPSVALPNSSQCVQEMTHLVEDIVELDRSLEESGKTLLASKDSLSSSHNAWITSNWSFFLASRLVINRLLEDCAKHLSQWSSIHNSSARSSPDSNSQGKVSRKARRDCVSKPPTALEQLPRVIRSSLANQSSLVESICDWIPRTIGLTSTFPSPPDSSSRSPLPSYFMMWPLHVALTAQKSIESQRRAWIRLILEFIAEKEGLQLAKILVNEPYQLLDQLQYYEDPSRPLTVLRGDEPARRDEVPIPVTGDTLVIR